MNISSLKTLVTQITINANIFESLLGNHDTFTSQALDVIYFSQNKHKYPISSNTLLVNYRYILFFMRKICNRCLWFTSFDKRQPFFKSHYSFNTLLPEFPTFLCATVFGSGQSPTVYNNYVGYLSQCVPLILVVFDE